jgi:exodeoxyribonuclease V beta subunit
VIASRRFDLLETPLEPGTTLLEASAGTGKTYAIAGIYLRLVAETGLRVDEILVVTFTRAATAELRGRIRNLLALAQRSAAGRPLPASGESALVSAILQRSDRAVLGARLASALETFEQAPVCTIDSFCQRVLQEHAFETRTLFDAEFAADVAVERDRWVDDFWRRRFYGEAGTVGARMAESAGVTVESLRELARALQNLAEFTVDPDFESGAVAARVAAEREAGDGTAVDEGSLRLWAAALRAEFVEGFRRGLSEALERRRSLTFSDLRQRLSEALEGHHGPGLVESVRRRMRAALIDEFQDTDPVQFSLFRRLFADGTTRHLLCLVGDPKQAIYSVRGADVFAYLEAAGLVSRRFTLPANYRSESRLVEAVNAVFGRPGANPFVLPAIGFEPVEARGPADRYPFEEAGVRRPPLQVDWWEPGPGETVKAAQASSVAEKVADRIARMLGESRTGFAQPGGGFVRLRPRDVAVLVVRHGEAVLVEDALRARGIATVRQTQERIFGTPEAEQLRLWMRALVAGATERELRAAAAGVMVGWSAGELDVAGRQPARWSRLVAAFTEHGERWRRLGFLAAWEAFVSGSDLRDRVLPLPDGERRFTNLAQLAEILQRAAAAARLGPQALLDWFERHLADADGSPDDEHLLRLDRDDDAVRLVTIHASKGLEYPVVFCPFLWEPGSVRRKPGSPVAFHDPDDERRLHVDVSGSGETCERAKEIADGEGIAERLRLIYVALTRARNRCHVVWGAVPRRNGGSEGSALGWLLHPPAGADRIPLRVVAERLKERLKPGKEFADLRGELEDWMATLPAGSVALTELESTVRTGSAEPAPTDPAFQPVPRAFRGTVAPDWRVASYSSLTGHARELPEADAEPDTQPAAAAEPAVESPLPPDPFRGAAAGEVLHAIFERLPGLADTDTGLEGLVTERLEIGGYRIPGLVPRVVGEIRRTLAAPLAGTDGSSFRLSDVPMSGWRCEVPFHLPLRRIVPADLAEVAARHGRPGDWSRWPEALSRLGFDPVRGYLTGKIDLVFRQDGRFHVVDWKSNVLGPRPEDYTAKAVFEAMLASQYLLQYHLYLLALDRHLLARMPGYDPGRHLGGAWYLFVRGTDPAHPGRGVFHDRPTPEFLRELSARLVDDRRED